MFRHFFFKVENILKGSLDSIPSPSPSVKIQTMGGKVSLMCKSKTLLGILKTTLFVFKSLLTSPSNAMFCPFPPRDGTKNSSSLVSYTIIDNFSNYRLQPIRQQPICSSQSASEVSNPRDSHLLSLQWTKIFRSSSRIFKQYSCCYSYK